jgi:hypothetical protein
LSPIHHPSSSLTCIAMLRSSSVGTTRIGTTVPPRSTDPRLFQARATRPRPRSACATDDSEAARTRRAAAGTGTVVSFVVRLASAASLRAQLQGAHVHGHGHVVPRARRAEWKRSGTDRAGWQRAVGPVLHTVTLAAATRFHHRQGRDELTLVTDERRRTNGRNGTRDQDQSDQEGGGRVDWSARR